MMHNKGPSVPARLPGPTGKMTDPKASFLRRSLPQDPLQAWAGSFEIPKADASTAKFAFMKAGPLGKTSIAALPPKPIKAVALKVVGLEAAAPAKTIATTTVPAKLPLAPAATPATVGPATMIGGALAAFIVLIALFNIAEAIGARLSGKKSN